MKRSIFIIAILGAFFFNGQAQVNTNPAQNDTSSYPYWISMMQDPAVNFYKVQRAFNLYWENRPVTKGCGYKVFKRWEYMTQARILPNGDRPAPDAVMKAYDAYEAKNRSLNGAWVSMGPSVIPAPGPAGYEGLGRINTVAWHPTDVNKIYIGAPSGGFWKSADGGSTWVTTTDSLPTLGVSAIVVDWSNTSKILIGTGDRDAGDAPGLGVYKSLDGGVTWSASKTGMGDRTVGRIIQHPSNSQIFLAATSNGVYRSTDGGANWTQSKSGNFKDICFKPNDPTIVYAAYNSDFWRSSDNGVTFTQITSGLTSGQRGAIAVSANNPNYVYFLQSNTSSGYKGLYRSTDAGLTFTTRSTTPNVMDWSCDGSGTGGQGWYDLAIAADPANAEVVYVGGVNVFKSTNGGTTWTINSHWYGGCGVPAVHADCHFLGYNPVDGKLWAGNDGGVYYTANGGTNWTDRTVGITIGQIYKLGQSQTVKQQVINGFQDNGTYTYFPTGWEATGGGDGMECAVDYQNASYMYYTIYYGDIFRIINNSSDQQIAGNGVNGINESGGWVTPFILGENDPKFMFVGYKNIWRCTDVKATTITWTKISNNLGGSNTNNLTVVEQSPANTNILYAVRSDSKLFRTDNCLAATPTWVDLTSTLPASGTPSDIEAHPTDQNIVYMTMGTQVYKSPDKGLTWTNITGSLPSVYKSSIAYYKNAPEGLYVATDAGVYYKDQNTTGWVSFSAGLPLNAEITELDIFYDNDSVSQDAIRASSYGRGLWGSDMYNPYVADFTADSTVLCQGLNVDYTDLSTATPSSWSWSFPGGSPASSTLQNPQDIVYNTPGTFNVSLTAMYGSLPVTVTKNAYITVNPLTGTPAKPTGDTLLCENNSSTSYTIPAVTGATSYTWVLTPNTAGTLTGTDVTVVVDWDNTFTGYATIQVQANGTCGTSALSPGLQVHLRPFPGVPATPSGPTPLCQGVLTSQYTTAGGTNANSYDWMITPSSAGTITGTGTTGTVSWSPDFTGTADISVKSVNDCNESAYCTPLTVTMNVTPVVYLGADTLLCPTWSILLDAENPGASYLWSTGATTQTITVDSSGIGLGSASRWVNVNLNGCQDADTILITFSICEGTQQVTQGNSLAIFPNPGTGRFNLKVTLSGDDLIDIRVFDLVGKEVYTRQNIQARGNYSTVIDLSGLPEGVYYLRVTSASLQQVRKLIIAR